MHTPDTELAARLKGAQEEVVVGGCYTHYKDSAKLYTVVGLAIAESDESVQVIYRADYGARVIYTRPLESWMSTVDSAGETVKRFTLVG
jgi:hypothetical protein